MPCKLNKIYKTTGEIMENFIHCKVCKTLINQNQWDEGAGGTGHPIYIECENCKTGYEIISKGFKLILCKEKR